MDTKSLIIHIATTLFQQKGYSGVGLNEIINTCEISKGALYHHFPEGKEELLVTCLQSLDNLITEDMEEIFDQHATTQKATTAMILKLVDNIEIEGTIAGYTFSSIVSEMASLSSRVRIACAQLYQKIQDIYLKKLVDDGFAKEKAYSIALLMIATIEGGMMLCLTKKSSEPLKAISHALPKLIKEF